MSGYLQSNQVIILPYAATNISAVDTGKIFITPQTAAGVNVTYTLPTPSANLHYKFINGAENALDGEIEIATSGAANIIYGCLV